MSTEVRRTLAAAFATLTALVALLPVFHRSSWFPRAVGAILIVAAVGVISRRLHLPRALQPPLSLLLLATYVIVVFGHDTLQGGLPTGSTFTHLRALLDAAQHDVQSYAAPVPSSAGLMLVTTLGVGAVALAVDICAVVMDRVALSGLPLLALFAVPSAVLPHGLGPLAFAIGATGWMVLLMEEGTERVLRWGTPLRSALPGARAGGDDSSIGRVGRRIGAAALGLAVVVPVLVPGLDHRLVGNHGGQGDSTSSGPSSATTYNPITKLRDELTMPHPKQLFVYSTTDPHPDYLRMTTLDVYTGSGWASSKLQADRQSDRVQKGIGVPAGEDPGAVHQDFTERLAIDDGNLDVHWLPLPYGPRKVAVDGTWLWDKASQTVFSAAQTTKGLRPYTVSASRVVPTRDDLRSATSPPFAPELQQYSTSLAVPREVVALTERITRDATTPYDRAVAIQAYFTDRKNGFVYDLDPSSAAPGEDPLSAFLRGKHGFCQQYATAMAVLLRVSGIPSRVAVGFTAGQLVAGRTDTFSVTTADAHAWPEAWFSGLGWVRFEPTPLANGASTPVYSVVPPTGPAPKPAPSTTPRPQQTSGPGAFHDADQLLSGPPPPPPTLLDPTGHVLLWSLSTLGLVALLAGPWSLTMLRRRWRGRSGDPLVAWEQLQDDVHDVGAPWHAADSPRATAARLTGLLGPARPALDRLALAAEVARYAPAGRRTAVDLVADGTAVRRALRETAPRLLRVRAVLAPPSTLHWLGHTVGSRIADALDATDRFVAWVFRPLGRVLGVSR